MEELSNADRTTFPKLSSLSLSLADITCTTKMIDMIDERVQVILSSGDAFRLEPGDYDKKITTENSPDGTCLSECLWELALKLRNSEKDADMAVKYGIMPLLLTVLKNCLKDPLKWEFNEQKISECSLSILLELCRYRPSCIVLAKDDLLLHEVFLYAAPDTETIRNRFRQGPYTLNFYQKQAALDVLGRLIGGLSQPEDVSLLKDVSAMVASRILNEKAVREYELVTAFVHKLLAEQWNPKWFDFDRTLKQLRRVTDSGMSGTPIGGKGFTTHYSMERDIQKTMMEPIGKMLKGLKSEEHHGLLSPSAIDALKAINTSTFSSSDKNSFTTMLGARFCGVCRVTADHMKCCSRCKIVFYCCRDHQVADWTTHKNICVPMRAKQGF